MTDNTNINCPDSILSLYKIFSSGNTMMYIHKHNYIVYIKSTIKKRVQYTIWYLHIKVINLFQLPSLQIFISLVLKLKKVHSSRVKGDVPQYKSFMLTFTYEV
jgi:hypothetical protein